MKTAMQQLIEWGDKMIKEQPNKHLSFYEVIDKAEELLVIEKEQHIDAYSNGWHDGQDAVISLVKHIDIGGDAAGQEHYKETYGDK